MVLLDESRSKTRRHETAKQILILYRKKTQVWAEIDYYINNGSLMPVAVKPELKTDELQRVLKEKEHERNGNGGRSLTAT